ncbi:3-methyl-2-oxobutanoate hydroxymethyltransferase [Chitinasiproducens palmae]|uniref:3-methyl-2-oxobutanoate hydroxymethyltransferase n=1 Tax=Chitinasiproducens palmae TaxID=1770053 RepID=A0A1H2PRF8_9BURK|nr:3-methyl-2-oxobutanoate hydroxymethyltransferase [Chitinasiproducens palmae]SDV49455.1 ketopantoate hydroxymethyltransferase [Chitinasiproducens palmae]
MTYLKETEAAQRPITVPRLVQMRADGERIAMLTCYDASFATLLDRAGVDALLIGDSLGNVLQGHQTTLPVTLDDVAYHTACVARGTRRPLIISDLPFGEVASRESAYLAATRLLRAGAAMVKIEGGAWLADTVRFLVERSIPVCAHIGLTPQSVHAFGGFKVQGRGDEAAARVVEDARALEAAGAQLLVIEAVPSPLGARITEAISIPTIGIGAGVDCSGQVLVLHDMLGIYAGRRPRFVKDFVSGAASIEAGVTAYVKAVKDRSFPGPEHTFEPA